MPTGSSYVAQTDVYVHAEERVVTRNDGNLTRAHEAGEGIALCCIASQGHIVGGRTPQSLIKRYIFQMIVTAVLGGGVYAAVRAMLGSFSDCWCNEKSDGICCSHQCWPRSFLSYGQGAKKKQNSFQLRQKCTMGH